MSITSEEYNEWCTAVTNTNKAIVELLGHRKKNYGWMKTILREFFNDLGEIVNIHFEADASEITVRMTGEVKLDKDALSTLPFTFTIQEDLQDILFVLKPDVLSMEDLRE